MVGLFSRLPHVSMTLLIQIVPPCHEAFPTDHEPVNVVVVLEGDHEPANAVAAALGKQVVAKQCHLGQQNFDLAAPVATP